MFTCNRSPCCRRRTKVAIVSDRFGRGVSGRKRTFSAQVLAGEHLGDIRFPTPRTPPSSPRPRYVQESLLSHLVVNGYVYVSRRGRARLLVLLLLLALLELLDVLGWFVVERVFAAAAADV